jgi:hypothetical protein
MVEVAERDGSTATAQRDCHVTDELVYTRVKPKTISKLTYATALHVRDKMDGL